MKVRTLSSAAIVAALTLGALSPMTALADATELDSTGTVIVEEGGEEEIPGTVDPENPDKELPDPDPDGPDENENPDLAALMIEKTTDLDFGTIKTSGSDVTAHAAPMSFDSGATTRGAYVQWRDIRSSSAYGYTISAQMTQQFTSGSDILTASTIAYGNGMAVAQEGNTNIAPSTVATGFELELGVSQPVIVADKDAKEGKGRYTIEFGQSSDYTGTEGTAGTDAESVTLTVPSVTASNMAVGTYTAIVKWSIAATA